MEKIREEAIQPGSFKIPNQADYDRKILKLKAGGLKNLQLVLDFDGTITNIGGITSWGVIEKYNFSEEYKEKLLREYAIYHPIEIDHHTPYEVKVQKMVEWWEIAHADLTAQKLQRKSIPLIVGSCKDEITFREKTHEVLEFASNHKIPILVFSAGIGDTIVEMLKVKNCLFDNIHVVSNFMVFDKEGDDALCIGWNSPLIHVFNKHSVNMEEKPYYQEIVGRKNIILMGDSPGDRHMAEGLPTDCILKIGLLNVNCSQERLLEFCNYFDIIAIQDNTMNFLFNLLEEINSAPVVNST